jgi:hypothetical protein
MNESLKQFSEQLATDLKAKLTSEKTAEFIKQTKASGDDRTFEVVFSTSDEDRQGDELDQSKWDLKYYEMNPVVLWAHNYQGFPIGAIEDIRIEGNQAVATGKFAPEGVNPEADLACSLYQEKILRAVSPGYIQNDDGTRELLEVSFCPVPAGRYALSLRQIGRLHVSTQELVVKGFFYETKGAVSYADHGTADPDTAWDGPAEVKACGDDLKKLKAICAWFDSEDADVKSSYKLPHHRASDLKAVWKGVAAAGAVLQGGRGGVDIPSGDIAGVKTHLAKHYAQFGKTPPWEEKSEKSPQVGDTCELEDGTPGVLAGDDKNPGELICVPERDKSQKTETMKSELEQKFKAEHERHGKAVGKAIDEFEKKALVDESDDEKKAGHKEDEHDGADNSETDKAIEEFKDNLDSEHGEHLEKCMKAIDDSYETMGREPNEKKSIDEFKSAINTEHLKHVKTFHKAIDEFTKAWPGSDDENANDGKKKAIDEFETKASDELERHEKAHEELLKKEEPEGEEDEKALADAIQKAGRAISAKNKAKLKAILEKMESHHNDVTAAMKELIGSEDGDGGEEPSKKPKDDESEGEKALNSRSSTSGAGKKDMSELEAYLLTQRLVRQVKTASEGALRQINEKIGELRTGR